jgi:16S rRNA (adenine1518-N6/adenine1519-N6)-dimethyltransferase
LPDAGPDLPPLREIIARHGLDARRSLGQHFLLDLNLTRRIARAAGDLTQGTVIEIGPGPGGLTRSLLEAGAKHLIAIERDARCVTALGELAAAYPGRLEIVAGDALAIDAASLGRAPRRIVANLPYNISTALLVRWLVQAKEFESFTLMFQQEVAKRLAAAPGGKDYGRLTVLTQWLCEVELLFNIAKEAFVPPPKIVSTVARIRPRPQPLAPGLDRVAASGYRGGLRPAPQDAALEPAHPGSRASEPARGDRHRADLAGRGAHDHGVLCARARVCGRERSGGAYFP